ncbi:exodeoxyribonuclease VII large subunit [Christensenellaceae bacterium OttesenSCG-928-L17]|nr:exodeoxyribonuclease VII large subunit [Christensenellaceae bacterium OttesenSCG-928-L17]
MAALTLSVTQLNEYVSGLIAGDPMLRELRVQGEISGFKRHSSGHLYFSLKDEHAVVRCVMFRQAAQQLQIQPRDGMQVIISGYAALFQRDGQFQLYAQNIVQMGEGDLYRRFLLLKTQLEAKGYFDAAHKKPIPMLPACVGVITSDTGAVLQDIRNVIGRWFPRMHILVLPVRVQGPSAAQEIARAIDQMNREKRASVLIVGRGGGSIEDLWAFNELPVAEAIYRSEIPIISAVGHETDFTIADFVADLRAPTPSAAAELCVPSYDQLVQTLDNAVSQRLQRAISQALLSRRNRIEILLRSRGFAVVEHQLALKRQQVVNAIQKMQSAAMTQMQEQVGKLDKQRERLQLLSPTQMLGRGYALISDEMGKPVGSIAELSPNDMLAIQMHDGRATARVVDVQRRKREHE